MAAEKQMDAIALLKADHRKVEDLFEQFESARGAKRKEEIARKICLELTIHTKIEEEIFYPACRGRIDDELVDEAIVEHDSAKVLVAEIEAGGPDEDFYDAKVQVLSELIEHHVEEEEKRGDGMFAQARKAELDLDTLGEEMAARKAELMKEYKAEGVPTPEASALKRTGIG